MPFAAGRHAVSAAAGVRPRAPRSWASGARHRAVDARTRARAHDGSAGATNLLFSSSSFVEDNLQSCESSRVATLSSRRCSLRSQDKVQFGDLLSQRPAGTSREPCRRMHATRDAHESLDPPAIAEADRIRRDRRSALGYRAGEGIRTLDVNLGNVFWVQLSSIFARLRVHSGAGRSTSVV
jgi:hypothetical protein